MKIQVICSAKLYSFVCKKITIALLSFLVVCFSSEPAFANGAGFINPIGKNKWMPQPMTWAGEQAPNIGDTQIFQAFCTLMQDEEPREMAAQCEEYIKAYPDSAYVPALRNYLGDHYRDRGLRQNSLEQWEMAWEASKEAKAGSGKQVADYAYARMTRMLLMLGRYEMLNVLFQENAGRALDRPALQQMLLRTHEGFRLAMSHPESTYQCGVTALNVVARVMSGKYFDYRQLAAPKEAICSVKALAQLSKYGNLGLIPVQRLNTNILPVPSVMHLKINHYAAITRLVGNNYEVVDAAYGHSQIWTLQDINQEASGYFLMPVSLQSSDYRLVSDSEANNLVGRSYSYNFDDAAQQCCESGGECPCPPGHFGFGGGGLGGLGGQGEYGSPEYLLNMLNSLKSGGSPLGRNSGASCSNCGGKGMPIWKVMEPNVNLWLFDKPLYYQPSRGDEIAFSLSYKQRDEDNSFNPYFFGFGGGWNSRWLSYIHAPTDGSENKPGYEMVYLPGGGYKGFDLRLNGNPCRDFNNNSELFAHTNSAGDPYSYELTFPSGNRYYYDYFAISNSYCYIFLSAIVDNQGFTTTLNYTNLADGSVRLLSVIDADNHAIQFEYNAGYALFPNLISRVFDSAGRETLLDYDGVGRLTGITDAAGLHSEIDYNDNSWPCVLRTPYGRTTFAYEDPSPDVALYRSVDITEPTGGRQVYIYAGDCRTWVNSILWLGTTIGPVPSVPYVGTLDSGTLNWRNSFYWDAKQSEGLPSTIGNFGTNAFMRARMRHWLLNPEMSETLPDQVISWERTSSPDGTAPGQITWYDYAGKPTGYNNIKGNQLLPSVIARVLPNNETSYTYTEYNDWGNPTTIKETYTIPGQSTPGERVYSMTYSSDGLDLLYRYGPSSQLLESYTYNAAHQVTLASRYTDAQTAYSTGFGYDAYGRMISMTNSVGIMVGYYYGADGYLSRATNYTTGGYQDLTWQNGMVYSYRDQRGMVVTNSWDILKRPMRIDYPDGTFRQFIYGMPGSLTLPYGTGGTNILDLTASRDRLGNWKYFRYNGIRQLIAETNELNKATLYDYCSCGSPSVISNALSQITTFYYDNLGQKTGVVYPDNTAENYVYNSLGQLIMRYDSLGTNTYGYNNQGLQTVVSNAFGLEKLVNYDVLDHPTNIVNSSGVSVNQTFDYLGQVLSRSYPDNGAERLVYSARGLVYYTNQLLKLTQYAYDAAGRKTNEINPNNETIKYTYNPAGDLLTLKDGKNQQTIWHYDTYGRVYAKRDITGSTNFIYAYNANGWMTNRWTPAKLNTRYKYDAAGNLTNVDYPSSTDISLAYDALNRVTNQVDAAGTSRYTYDVGGNMKTEDGPFSSDVLTNLYHSGVRGLRIGYGLQQFSGAWTNAFAYDAARRMTNVTSAAGAFSYQYPGAGGQLSPGVHQWQKLLLPNNAYITNAFDNLARLTNTVLYSSGSVLQNQHAYAYNAVGMRTNQTRTDASYVNYGYDNYGQLQTALGYSSGGTPITTEQYGYAYDAAWNLLRLTNNGSVTTRSYNSLNQLPSPPYDAYTYDANGNLTAIGSRTFTYDDENQLVAVADSNYQKTAFTYDAKGRLRIRQEYSWVNSVWSLTDTINYVYDGMMVVQMRASSSTSSYTRGLDLSLSLQGAGGIGGLLAQSTPAHSYYHSDGNGNVTYLMKADQSLGVSYRYDDAYGNVVTTAGTLANPFRFSSKEWLPRISAYYYGYRFYYPSIQRWLNRDPLGELGFEMLRDGQTDLIGDDPNLYAYVKNNPENQTDSLGLASSGSATLVTEPTLLMSEEAAKAYAAKQCRCAALKLATQAAKKAASSLGGCKGTDSCDVLLAKSLAWLALAGARTAENSICFDGGNPGHKKALAEALAAVANCTKFQIKKGCTKL